MQTKRGFGLVEIIIASAVISVSMVSLAFVLVLSARVTERAGNRLRANFLTEETLETLRFLRDTSWSSNFSGLTPGITYYPSFNNSTFLWSIVAINPGLVDNLFSQRFSAASVMRSANDDIISAGGTVDADTLKITASTTWDHATNWVEAETYLSDIFDK